MGATGVGSSFRFILLTGLPAVLAGAVVLAAADSRAGLGDCSQPVSSGSGPIATDCLRILRVAVGSASCTPECICAPNGSLPARTTDALRCLRKAVGQDVALMCPCASLSGDNFNDNSKDPALWGTDIVIDGNGVLTETSQTLRFTVGSASELDYTTRPWIAGVIPYDADWTAQIDVSNTTTTSSSEQSSSFGISIFDENDFTTEAYVELYASESGGPPTYRGFFAELYHEGEFVALADSLAIDGLSSGTVRASFDADTKVVTFSYDVNTANSTVFILLGSFGLDGSGGADGNSDWGFGDSDRFVLSVYGYSKSMTIPAGTLFGDNFQVTGAVYP